MEARAIRQSLSSLATASTEVEEEEEPRLDAASTSSSSLAAPLEVRSNFNFLCFIRLS